MRPSQNLYRPAVEDTGEVEEREKYRPGGYHPIHFNDYLDPNRRFNVIHKLGWGISSTVWLCLDKNSMNYKAIKVMTAEQSGEDCQDLRILKAMEEVSRRELEENCIVIPDEYFWIEGPNGRHLCLVSDLLGPSLFRNTPLGMGIHTPELLTDLTFQVSKGIQYLHKKGICHGDLRPSNVLMQLHQYTLMELSDSQIDEYLGPRECEALETLSGRSSGPHGPRYLALPASLERLEERCRTGQVAIIDFGHSFYDSNPPKSLRRNRQYAGAEVLFTKTSSGFPRDIWALACTIYEIRLQTQLFSEYQDYTSLIRQMELWFGPLPVEHRRVARTYLEGDKSQRKTFTSKKKHPDHSRALGDGCANPSQLLSLTLKEERQERKRLLKVLGTTEWSHPLHASLGEERRCYVHGKSLESDVSSSDTDSDPDSTPVDRSKQVEGGKGSATPTSPTKTSTLRQDNGSNGNKIDQSTTRPTLHEFLKQTGTEDSTLERDPKRRRISRDLTRKEKEAELVEQVVTMPREEVVLLSDLLLRMFKHDPKERIDIEAVVNHEYWGDRRENWPINYDDFVEESPDPISSRTRSQIPHVEQETEPESS